ncbi:uncharacterized protein LOC122259533 [Penaeus japonicus]|uniref:uncharacterized protein LOC122259533 n=1 Tax=Penaeus japonicus TaxID=27405 RepID=UPI001C70DA6B|nr:uncharacterized protein LOC122259533 [Penaeus japonicus]
MCLVGTRSSSMKATSLDGMDYELAIAESRIRARINGWKYSECIVQNLWSTVNSAKFMDYSALCITCGVQCKTYELPYIDKISTHWPQRQWLAVDSFWARHLTPTQEVIQPYLTTMSSSPSPSSSKTKVSVFSRKDAFKFRIYRMLDEASEVMLFVLFWSTKCLKKKTQTYWDFFTKEEGLTPSKLKNDFQLNATMKHQLQSKPEKDFDITLLSTCIKCACRKRSDVQDLLDHVKSIKDFRNAFIHAGLDDISSFIPKTNELQQLLTNLLKAAETAFSIPTVEVSNLMATMTNNVNEIATQSLSPSDMATCRSKLLLEKLRIDGISELKTKYEKLKYITPLHYLNEDISLHVGMVYIQLEIVTADKHTGGHQVKYTDLFKSFRNWPGGNPSNKAQVILIEVPAGVGKTSLTRLLINDWNEEDSLIEGLVDFDFLIHAECRMPHIGKFSELLEFLISDFASEFEGDELCKGLFKNKVLVIVDGLDEMNDSSKQLFQEILYFTQTSPNLYVLATTRPEAVELFYDLRPAGTRPTQVKIKGIPENKREEFAIKYHEQMKVMGHECDTRQLQQYLRRMSVNFTDYWRIPLHLGKLVMLWALWPDTLNGVTTVTELLKEMEDLITHRIKERVIKNPTYGSLSPRDITRKIEDFFRPELYKIAFLGQKEDLLLSEDSERNLNALCESLSLPPAEVLGGFFVQRITWTRKSMVTKYSYTHRGMQDFYSALYILRSIITQKKEGRPRRSIRDLLENRELKQFQEVFKHLIGLVYTEEKIIQEETSEEVVQLLEESGVKDKDAWLDILSNVKANDTISRLVSKYVPDVLNLKGHTTITDSQSEIYSKLLATASPEKVTVSLRSSPNRVPGLQELFQTMCLLACEVEVYFHRNFLQPSTASSPVDSPLLRLFERGTITKYMGCATKDILAGLPDSIRLLYMSVADQSQLEDLMSAVIRLKGLEWLCIHAAAGVEAKSHPALCNIKHILYKREGGGGDSSAEYDSDSSEEDDSDSSEEDEEITFTMREPTSTSLDKFHMEELTFILCRTRFSGTLDIDKNFVCKLSHLEKVLDVLKCFLEMEEKLILNFRSGCAGGGSQSSVAKAPRPPNSAFMSDSHVPPSPPMTSRPSRSLTLRLDIPGDPEDIPRLRELLVAIGEKEGDLILSPSRLPTSERQQ